MNNEWSKKLRKSKKNLAIHFFLLPLQALKLKGGWILQPETTETLTYNPIVTAAPHCRAAVAIE